MTSSRTTSPRKFALLLVSMAAISAIGVIAALSILVTRGPSRGEPAQVAPVELDGGQGAKGGHGGSEPDRRDAKRPQGNAEVAEPVERASEPQSQAAGSTAEPASAPAVVVAEPAPPSHDQSSGGGAGSPGVPAPAPDPAGVAPAPSSTTSSPPDDDDQNENDYSTEEV
jgi:hypothetical protein